MLLNFDFLKIMCTVVISHVLRMRQVGSEAYITLHLREKSHKCESCDMAATREAYLDVQQMCDYVLLKHVNVSKDAETEKLYKVQINLCFLLYSA